MSNEIKTSRTHPIRVDPVRPKDGCGRIGVTLCPGKKYPWGLAGNWERDLDLDLDRISRWGATAVVSLITREEIRDLEVQDLSRAVADRHMEWWHLPIPDGQPPGPEFEKAWVHAGAAIRDRLRLGFDVLVHCKGGLGRAGTVAARLLVEFGERPDVAIDRVRAARSPNALETRDQERHVHQCETAAPALPSTTAESIRDRAIGAFLGLAVGDAVGTTLEFKSRDEQRVADMVGGGPFGLPAGAWTDDTTMALALAESLAECDALDCRDLMDRFVRWWKDGEYSCTGGCFDIGNTTRAALARYERTGDPLAGSTDPHSAGNGSLMRLSPVALRFWDDRALLDAVAAEQSRTTHGAPEYLLNLLARAQF